MFRTAGSPADRPAKPQAFLPRALPRCGKPHDPMNQEISKTENHDETQHTHREDGEIPEKLSDKRHKLNPSNQI